MTAANRKPWTCPTCDSEWMPFAAHPGDCPTCSQGLAAAERQRALRAPSRLLALAHVPERFATDEASVVHWSERFQRPLPPSVLDWSGQGSQPPFAFITGATGSGKSGLAAALLLRALEQDLRRATSSYWLSVPAFLDAIDSRRGADFGSPAHGVVATVSERIRTAAVLVVDALFFDGIGEKEASLASRIVRSRYEAKRPTIVTTQSSLADMKAVRLTASLASMLRERGTTMQIDLGSRDHRLDGWVRSDA